MNKAVSANGQAGCSQVGSIGGTTIQREVWEEEQREGVERDAMYLLKKQEVQAFSGKPNPCEIHRLIEMG